MRPGSERCSVCQSPDDLQDRALRYVSGHDGKEHLMCFACFEGTKVLDKALRARYIKAGIIRPKATDATDSQ